MHYLLVTPIHPNPKMCADPAAPRVSYHLTKSFGGRSGEKGLGSSEGFGCVAWYTAHKARNGATCQKDRNFFTLRAVNGHWNLQSFPFRAVHSYLLRILLLRRRFGAWTFHGFQLQLGNYRLEISQTAQDSNEARL